MSQQPYKLKLIGQGLSFDRAIDEATATSIMNLVLTGSVTNAGGAGAATGAGAPANSGGNVTPKQFLAQKRPTTEYERVACLAYYLTHTRNTPQFKTNDLTALNTEAAQRKLSNPSVAVGDATTKYGYLSSAGDGKKQITNLGEIVVDALPDREKVKQAIAENRTRKKKRKAARKRAAKA